MGTFDLTDEQLEELHRLQRLYRREADRCLEAKSYLAACVMIAALLESALLEMCHLYWKEIPDAVIPRRRGGQKELTAWSLAELLSVAGRVGWLPAGLSLPIGDESRVAAGELGVFGYLEVYRGRENGHRMVNLRLALG